MAQDPRSKTNGKPPIMRHPLFPATVALWFGALFGLGSLAIRPSLLESAVLALHLDAFIAAAAPPLGVTARILLATCMAALGCFLGAAIARRISRPKPVIRERMRSASAVGNAHKPARRMYASAVADEAEDRANPDTPRRRQLAVKEHEAEASRPEFRESAPLPGGSPKILDVSEFDLEGFQADETDERALAADRRNEPERDLPGQADGMTHGHDDAEEREFAAAAPEASPVLEPLPDALPGHVEAAGTDADNKTDWMTEEMQDSGEPADFESPPTQELASLRNGLFDAYSQGIAANPEAGAEADAPAPAPFAQPDAEAARDIAQEPTPPRPDPSGFAEEQAPAEQAGEYRSIFEPSPAPRLFAERVHTETTDIQVPGHDDEVAPAAAPFKQPAVEDVGAQDEEADAELRPTAPFDMPTGREAPESGRADASPADGQPGTSEHRQDDNAEPDCTPATPPEECRTEPMPEACAAERIATAELDELSQVELLERLALSMQRRSKRKEAAEEAVAEVPPVEIENDIAREVAVADSGSAPEFPVESGTDQPGVSMPPIPIPAAMQPVGLGEDDESELLPSFVPPRHISMPQQPAAAQAEPTAETAATPDGGEQAPETHASPDAPFARPLEGQEAGDEEADDDSRILEEGYSSLLDLSRPATGKQKFVRIEEPEHLDHEVEPVVIFPGRESAGDGPFARPAAAPESSPFARRDAAGTGEGSLAQAPVAPPSDQQATAEDAPFAPPSKRQDPEETERALRAALATLQRMSGAA